MFHEETILELESRKSFEFFWEEANSSRTDKGFGLIRDRAPGEPGVASIASVGFGLTALVIGIERGWISFEAGRQRVLGTLETLLYNIDNVKGFFYHFLDMETGKRIFRSEVSIIDTAIVICGGLTCGEYFGGEIRDIAQRLYERVNWQWYFDPVRNQFYMGYSPEKWFSGWWDFYAEQLMMYFLAAASPTFPVRGDMFYSFGRNKTIFKNGTTFINSWFGSLFTHQFSHAWFDLRSRTDDLGSDWWDNSVTATLLNRQFCMERSDKFKTFSENSWGLTPCDGPRGYNGRYGCSPSAIRNNEHFTDGTVPPCGAAGSIIFTPELSIAALNNYYKNYPKLWGKYGFKDSFNVSGSSEWYGEDVIGIDKGITLLMIENYRTGLVWNYFMKNQYARLGLERVGLIEDRVKDVS